MLKICRLTIDNTTTYPHHIDTDLTTSSWGDTTIFRTPATPKSAYFCPSHGLRLSDATHIHFSAPSPTRRSTALPTKFPTQRRAFLINKRNTRALRRFRLYIYICICLFCYKVTLSVTVSPPFLHTSEIHADYK